MKTGATAGRKRYDIVREDNLKKHNSLFFVKKNSLLYLDTGVRPPRCTRDRTGASQYFGSSEIHPGAQPQWLGWSGLLQVKGCWTCPQVILMWVCHCISEIENFNAVTVTLQSSSAEPKQHSGFNKWWTKWIISQLKNINSSAFHIEWKSAPKLDWLNRELTAHPTAHHVWMAFLQNVGQLHVKCHCCFIGHHVIEINCIYLDCEHSVCVNWTLPQRHFLKTWDQQKHSQCPKCVPP